MPLIILQVVDHMKTVHGETDVQLRAPCCMEKMSWSVYEEHCLKCAWQERSEYWRSVKDITEEEKAIFYPANHACIICQAAFPSPTTLRGHLEKIHAICDKGRPYKCHVCSNNSFMLPRYASTS